MLKKISIMFLIMLVSFGAFSCKKGPAIEGLGLEVTFSEEKLSDNLVTDVLFTWKTNENFVALNEDFSVYVHFWHNDNLLFQDDHNPEVATTQWEPNKEYTYTRRVFIPPFIDEFDPNFKGEEDLRLVIGLASPYDRTGESKQDVLAEKLKVYPPPLDTPEVIYEEGWYDLEIDPDAFLKQWRWTAQRARCIIDNPHRDALLMSLWPMKVSSKNPITSKRKCSGKRMNSICPSKRIKSLSQPRSMPILRMRGSWAFRFLLFTSGRASFPFELGSS
jgi:hypothetical protein